MLFGLIGSHTVLETARDALFLSKIPASRLPLVYIAIAVISLVVTRVQARIGRGLGRRTALSVWTALAGTITFGFWAGMGSGVWALYALYAWSGVLTTLVLVHFWMLLGDIFSVTQAKRLYSLIGAGSVLGAIVGSAVAGAIASVLDAKHLLLISAVGCWVTALVPRLMKDPGSAKATQEDAESKDGIWQSATYVYSQPYARRVAALVVLSTAALTLADYLFKSTVAQEVPAAQLGSFFASVYLVLNILSLVAQLYLVGLILRRFDLFVALCLLPALLLLGGVGLLATGTLYAALLMKGADGALKHSLHRTASELLFVPMTERSRARVKAFIDVAGQRGGQALASVSILTAAALGAPRWILAVGLIVLTVLWFLGAGDIRRFYLELFRGRLHGGVGFSDFPELDVASLETLIQALDSDDDDKVIAALDVLEREGRAKLIPALILYHPSESVVIRALALFTTAERKSVVSHVRKLLEHSSTQVRSMAVAAISVLAPSERELRMMLSTEESPQVRAAVMVNLIASSAIMGQDAQDALDGLINHGAAPTRVGLANAIARRNAQGFESVLLRLAEAAEPEVRLAAAKAMGKSQAEAFLEPLIGLVDNESTRRVATSALKAYGDTAQGAVERVLSDDAAPLRLRWELPRLLCLLSDRARAARFLLHRLPVEKNGFLRYRSIQALEMLVEADTSIELEQTPLQQTIEATISRAYRYLDRRYVLSQGAARAPERATEGHALLLRALEDKKLHAVERLFRLLGLLYPAEGFEQIARGVQDSRKEVRAGSIELLENILRPPLRSAVIGLVDELDEAERLAQAGPFHQRIGVDYEPLLEQMLRSSSRTLQDMTVFHIGELRLKAFLEPLRGLQQERPSTDGARAIELLEEV